MEPNSQTGTLTPAAVAQLVGVRAAQLVAQGLPELAGLINVVGRLSSLGEARGAWHYAVRLTDDAGSVQLDIPVAIARASHLAPGMTVRATGVMRIQSGRPGNLEFRLVVSQIFPVEAVGEGPLAWPTAAAARMTIDRLKSLTVRKMPFPTSRPVRISLVRSSSPQAQVAQDTMAELRRVAGAVELEQLRVNILDATQIAEAIARASGNVLILIRGGGDAADFDVFDDPRVVEAMAAKRAYRVIGLGHSGNSTLLDLVAEHSAPTPAQAGMHVREQIEAAPGAAVPATPGVRRQAPRFWRLVDSVPAWAWGLVVLGLTAAIAAIATG